jgi:hypothetical protein
VIIINRILVIAYLIFMVLYALKSQMFKLRKTRWENIQWLLWGNPLMPMGFGGLVAHLYNEGLL